MTVPATNHLVQDPGRPALPILMMRFIGAEVRNQIRLLSIRLGVRRLYDVVPDDWRIPDSQVARDAIQTATELCPEFMVRHCFRSYCFGALIASRNKFKLDRETFFLSAMLHDLALGDEHLNNCGSFEWVGAKLAHTFCLDAQLGEERAALVHNAIALHTSLGVADQYQPEIAMLHFGTAMDLFGMRIDEIPKNILESVLDDYSRSDFKAEFSPCLAHQAQAKPHSHIAGAVGVGILDRIKLSL